MPAALEIDRSQVQMLVLTYGVREAARQLGLSEGTVGAWSARGRWLADAPKSVPPPKSMVQTVQTVSPVNALQNRMREDALHGRAAALSVTRKALERANQYDADELMVPDVAQVVSTYVKSAATAGGYAAADSVVKMNLSITGQGNPGAGNAQTLDAEIVQDVQGEELP